MKVFTAGSYNILLKSPFIIAVTLLIQLHLGSGHGVVEPRRFHLVVGTSVYVGRIFCSNLRQFPQPFRSNPHTSSNLLLLLSSLHFAVFTTSVTYLLNQRIDYCRPCLFISRFVRIPAFLLHAGVCDEISGRCPKYTMSTSPTARPFRNP